VLIPLNNGNERRDDENPKNPFGWEVTCSAVIGHV